MTSIPSLVVQTPTSELLITSKQQQFYSLR